MPPTPRPLLLRFALLLAMPLLLETGCLVGPDFEPPRPELPDRWHQELVAGPDGSAADLGTWWRTLGDPTLDSLIARAGEGSLDLRAAVARIQEAGALRGIATGQRFPDIDGDGAIASTRASEEIAPFLLGRDRTETLYATGGSAFWEIDLWGRIARSIESADASLAASIEDYRDVRVSLYAEVATAYVELRALEQRIRYARANIELQRASLQLTSNRRDAGIGSDLEVSQALLNLSTTESFLPLLRVLRAQEVHRLGVLLGESPAALYPELAASSAIPEPDPEVASELPADLLRRRPDIRRAERDLAAQTAAIGIAQAELYPEFSLFGVLSFEAFDGDEVLKSGSRTYVFGPSFRWNLFDGGRVRSAIRVEDARTEQALAAYEQSVLVALEDVENSLVAYHEETERRDALHRSVLAAEKSSELVVTLYKTGLSDFQNVLDTQRSLFEQQDQFAQSQGLRTQQLISIYRALGGGWQSTPSP